MLFDVVISILWYRHQVRAVSTLTSARWSRVRTGAPAARHVTTTRAPASRLTAVSLSSHNTLPHLPAHGYRHTLANIARADVAQTIDTHAHFVVSTWSDRIYTHLTCLFLTSLCRVSGHNCSMSSVCHPGACDNNTECVNTSDTSYE